MRKKTKILLVSYLTVTILALSLYAWAGQWGLGWYRRTANESATLAFEETVRATEALSKVLSTAPYATDAEMCDKICCEAYACAAAAESALSTLPFSTQELEMLSAFLNTAGDYAHSLCGSGAAFSREQREDLTALAETAERSAQRLLSLREGLQDRALRMDSRERRLRNVGEETGPRLSQELLAYEGELSPLALRYDGRYGTAEERRGGLLTEAEMLRVAAAFLDMGEAELKLQYDYEGAAGLRCYRAGDSYVCVNRAGVQSMAQDRLVSETKLTPEEARQAAADFLPPHGFPGLTLLKEEQRANTILFTFAQSVDEALCPENCLQLAIALDDGSLYAFDASRYDPATPELRWDLDEAAAGEAVPAELEVQAVGRMVLRSAGGRDLPCYVFSCAAPGGRAVEIAVSAETGKQVRITLV